MADGQRDQMLVDFQECTQIEDIETCIDILEQNGWNLMSAIQSVMPHAAGDPEPPPYNSASQISVSGVSTEPVDMDYVNSVDICSSYDPGSASGPYSVPSASTSYASRGLDNPRMLNFTIEYRGRNVTVNLLDTEHVGKIKECLFNELNIPVDKQDLRGWPCKRVDDKKTLRDLNLPRETTLYLLAPELNSPLMVPKAGPSSSNSTEVNFEGLSREYTLHITYKDTGNEYNLKFTGCKTVGEVKGTMYHLTNIPSRYQVWTGWPDTTGKDDTLTLAACGLKFPVHDLELSKANIVNKPKYQTVTEQIDISDDEDESHDSYPIEEDLFDHDESTNRKQSPLIPASVVDTTDALEHFTREFRERYGESHPVFYVGSLDNAIKEALMGKAKDRKLLAVYLHHDNSVLSNVFCSQILCQDSIVSYLCNNFITWAWDMTHDTNSARFVTMATRHFGSVVAGQVRFTKPDQLPVLLIISRARATNEVVDLIQGSVTLDELMMRLMNASETFHAQQMVDIKDEEEREARDNIRQEQEIAFQESLAKDRAKAEAQRLEQEREMKQQEEEERQKKEEEDRKQALQESAAMHLREEPPTDCKEAVSRLRIRTPKGEMLQRRFYASDKLKYLIYYITSLGYHTEEHKILTTFPRRDVSQLDEEKSLQELKIYPQETLILEERQTD